MEQYKILKKYVDNKAKQFADVAFTKAAVIAFILWAIALTIVYFSTGALPNIIDITSSFLIAAIVTNALFVLFVRPRRKIVSLQNKLTELMQLDQGAAKDEFIRLETNVKRDFYLAKKYFAKDIAGGLCPDILAVDPGGGNV